MANSENVIRIPKPPKDAFNQDRLVSELLWEQVEHLAGVVERQVDEERRAVRTEGQARDFIKKTNETRKRLPKGKKGSARDAAKISRITRLPRAGVNKNAPVSEPLWEQAEDLAAVVIRQIEDERRAVRTEGQASAFIQRMTAIVHPQAVTNQPTRSSKAATKKRPRSSKR